LIGGGERSLLDLLTSLPDDVEPALGCPPGPLMSAGSEHGVPVCDVPESTTGLKLGPRHIARAAHELSSMALAIRRHARRFGADLQHANSIRAGLAAALAHSLGAPPAVVHVRDCLPPCRVANGVRALIHRRAAAIVAISEYTARNFAPQGRNEKITVLLDPVDLTPFYGDDSGSRARARRQLGIAERTPVLTVVAQLTPWKGQDDAIRALASLRQQRPDARLLVVGEPKFVSAGTRFDNRAYFRSLKELTRTLGVHEAVDFLGERDDLPTILHATDVALVPSWEEPFGRSVVEAMAAGTSVIATSVGGPAEIIDDGVDGILLPPREPEQWAGVAERLLGDTALRTEMGERARGRVQRLFDGRDQVDGLMDVYRRVTRSAS
jgi:glycosyltransferase involved in cell wall biosynthesis